MAKQKVWSGCGHPPRKGPPLPWHDFDFSKKGKVMVTMMEYTKNIIMEFPEEITGTKMSPAANHLVTARAPSLARMSGNGVPSCDSSTLVSEPKGATGHSAHHCLSNNKSEVARQGQLGQGQEGAEIPEGYSAHMPLILSADLLTLSLW
jgi:hypothetical protein